jgi:hypothetical protein
MRTSLKNRIHSILANYALAPEDDGIRHRL